MLFVLHVVRLLQSGENLIQLTLVLSPERIHLADVDIQTGSHRKDMSQPTVTCNNGF